MDKDAIFFPTKDLFRNLFLIFELNENIKIIIINKIVIGFNGS